MGDMSNLERALGPYEKELRSQERLRKVLGVRSVDQPTYERYVTGTVGRYDRRRIASQTLKPDNPFGEEFRARFKAKTGFEHYRDRLPHSELERDDRVGQSLSKALRRLYHEYHPERNPLPITPPEGKVDASDRRLITRLVKKVALLLGAEMVRVTKLDQRWVYEGIEIEHKYAIVCVVPHNRSLIDTAPSHLAQAAVSDTYCRLKVTTTQLADFIRSMGYDAVARETLNVNPEMLMIPVAIDAGVGEYSRCGRVLSPEFGSNMRLKAVTTDLPLEIDPPISFGVHEFCMACDSCAVYCPPQAIPYGEPADSPPTIHGNPGYRKWYVNAEKCITFFAANKKKWTTCAGRCISVCPWTHERNLFHNAVRWLAIHSPHQLRKLLVSADKRFYKRSRVIPMGRRNHP